MHDYKELNDHGVADALEQETPSRPTKNPGNPPPSL
jgi:hypothetical protein